MIFLDKDFLEKYEEALHLEVEGCDKEVTKSLQEPLLSVISANIQRKTEIEARNGEEVGGIT